MESSKTMECDACSTCETYLISIISFFDSMCDSRCKIRAEVEMNFARDLVLFLQDHRDDILSSPANRLALNRSLEAHSREIQAAIDRIICRFMTAASDWVISVLQDSPAMGSYCYCRKDYFCGAYVRSVPSFLWLCLKSGKTEMCQSVLDAVLEAPGNERTSSIIS